jgi:hypothetical protein
MRGPLGVAAMVALLAAATASAAPPSRTYVDVWGQPDASKEVAGRPLGRTLGLFTALHRTALTLPTAPVQPLPTVSAHIKPAPGRLELRQARRVTTAAGDLYLVPASRGGVCIQGPRFATCHRGLLRQGVTWGFYSTDAGIDVIGLAANDVARVVLTDGVRRWPARLRDNVFSVARPIVLRTVRHIPPLGTLVVSYRGGKPAARVPLR